MEDPANDVGRQLMLDGNSVAGLLYDIFGAEMTDNPARCAHCGTVSVFGAMLLFGHAMGAVLRCPGCEGVMMRVVERPGALWLDMQGMSNLRLQRQPRSPAQDLPRWTGTAGTGWTSAAPRQEARKADGR